MQQMFVELYKYRSAWKALPSAERDRFAAGVLEALKQVEDQGIEVLGWASNNPATDRRAPYDFFCVYRVPSAQMLRGFEEAIVNSGWHNYFEQVALSGDLISPAELLGINVSLLEPSAQPDQIRRDP